jgi:chromosomal replication initiation ATPase DnaA
MTRKKSIEEANKTEVRKYAQQLFGDKYFISFVAKDKKSKYTKEISNDIPKIEDILKKVQKELNFCNNLVSRKSDIIAQKYTLMYYLKNNLNYRQRSIAHVLTNGDHSTVHHACKKVSDFLSIKDDLYINTLQKIQTII